MNSTIKHVSHANNSRGLTLIEVLVVIAILTLMALAIVPKAMRVSTPYQLDATLQDFVQVVRLAQTRAMQSEGSSAYSVHLVAGSGGSFTLYRGTTYASRDTNYDEVHTLPNALTLSYTVPDTDINFTKLEGATTDVGGVTISWPDGNMSKAVTINSYGLVDRQ